MISSFCKSLYVVVVLTTTLALFCVVGSSSCGGREGALPAESTCTSASTVIKAAGGGWGGGTTLSFLAEHFRPLLAGIFVECRKRHESCRAWSLNVETAPELIGTSQSVTERGSQSG